MKMSALTKFAAIMQPAFLPWLGYFSLIDQVDTFIFLDDVQFSKQSWQSRNRVSGPNGPVFLSLPVARKPSKPLIKDALLADQDIQANLLSRAAGSLEKAPFWGSVEGILKQGLYEPVRLVDVNINLIKMVAAELGLRAEFLTSSELGVPLSGKSERLRELCSVVGAETYLSPVGSIDYLREEDVFSEQDVRLRFINFEHPVYEQQWGAFQSHMSVIDGMAYVGSTRILSLIRKGTKVPFTTEQILESNDETV